MANNPKGMLADLTAISTVLSGIAKQLQDISKEAKPAGEVVEKLTKSAKGSKAASGGDSMANALASVPDTGSKKSRERRVKTADVASDSSGGGNDGENTLDGALGGFGRSNLVRASGMVAGSLAAVNAVSTVAQAAANALPQASNVMSMAGGYYAAALNQGNVSSRQLQQSAVSSGLTKTGASAQITQYLSNTGITFSNDPNSEWQQKSRAISNAVTFLNMDPGVAAQAITGLNSGTTSRNLYTNMGVSTSSQATGKAYTQDQIFQQMWQRLTAGQNIKSGQEGVKQINDSFYRGNLGQSLQQSGLSSDQAEMFRQWAIQKVGGGSMDLSNSQKMSALSAKQTAQGNENPYTSAYTQNASQEQMQMSFIQPYIDGVKAATPLIVGMNKALEGLDPRIKMLSGMFQTLSGSRGTGAAISALTAFTSGLISVTTEMKMTSIALKKIAASVGGGGGGAAAAGEAAILGPKGKSPKGGIGAMGKLGKGLGWLGVATGAIDSVTTGVQSFSSGQQASSMEQAQQNSGFDWGGLLGSMGSGALTGGLLTAETGPGALVGAIGGAIIGGITYAASTSGAAAAGYSSSHPRGGDNNSVGTGQLTQSGGSRPTFLAPTNGKIGDLFGATEGRVRPHRGLDYVVPEGTPVMASADGVVSSISSGGELGNYIEISHAGGYVTGYAHLSQVRVRQGDKVTQGQVIALSGNTGTNTTGAHLHFVVKYNGSVIDPQSVLGKGVATQTSSSQRGKQTQKSAKSSPSATAAPTSDAVLSAIKAQLPAASSPSSYSGASASSGSSVSTMSASGGSNGRTNTNANVAKSSDRNPSMSLPGAKSYKQGDSYVAQDSHVNVHTGEAILTAEQADVWREAIKEGYGAKSKGRGNNVVINLTLSGTSQAEAQRFAEMVKGYLEEDNRMTRMGTR